MRHYLFFAGKVLAVIVSPLVAVGLIFLIVSGLMWAGTVEHVDYGTASKASGYAAKTARFHDLLVTRLNANIAADPANKPILSYGENIYSFFDTSRYCNPGFGKLRTSSELASTKYFEAELSAIVERTLIVDKYRYDVVQSHVRGADFENIEFRVFGDDGATSIHLFQRDPDAQDSIFPGNHSTVTTSLNGGEFVNDPCYPIDDLPKPPKYLTGV